jgi:hypothetical protein
MAAEHSDATVIPLPTAAKRKVKQGGIRAARVYRQQYPWRGLYVPPPLRAAMEEFKKSGGTTIKPDDDSHRQIRQGKSTSRYSIDGPINTS